MSSQVKDKSFAVKQMKTVNMNLLLKLLPAPNVSHADDRWRPILTSHVHGGKHHRCALQRGLAVLSCKTGGALSHPQAENSFQTLLFLELNKSFKSEAEKPELCNVINFQEFTLLVLFTNIVRGNC